jgi:hypothetical protein
MRLYGRDNILTAYWAELEPVSEFRVYIDREGIRPLILTKIGDKTVAAYLKYKEAHGALILLPYINFDREDFTRTTKAGYEHWTDKADQIGKKFISALVGIDNSLHQGQDSTPVPDWVSQDRYVLTREQYISNKLLTLETKLQSIQKEKEQLQQTLSIETEIKGLLYEKGPLLEAAILKSLNILGFECHQYRESDSEFDVVFESKEGRFIGEAEGKDNKAVNIDKLRQLQMNIHEDFSRDEVDNMAKGALIGNAYRLLPPEQRGDFFTQKCLIAANRSDTALVKTDDLFYISRYLSAKKDKAFAKKCRKAILQTIGLVIFPDIPELEPQSSQRLSINPAD